MVSKLVTDIQQKHKYDIHAEFAFIHVCILYMYKHTWRTKS